MVDWNPGQLVPEQLGDAFAALYDWFEPFHAADADNELWIDDLPECTPYRLLTMAVERTSVETPQALQRYIDAELAKGSPRDVARAVYFGLCAIDRGTTRQNPLESGASGFGANLGLLQHYLRYHRFNTDVAAGFVLPKWTGPRFRGSTSAFEDHFVNLVRARADRRYVRLLGRSGSGARRRRRGDIEEPGVVIVPMLYEFFDDGAAIREASFTEEKVGIRNAFKVEHNPAALLSLKARVAESVDAIHRSGAVIAIYPELVLNRDLLDTLRQNLVSASRDDAYRGSNLDWIMVGAGLPARGSSRWPIVNVCQVMDRYGNVLHNELDSGERLSWVQEKRYRYELTKEEQKAYGVTGCFSKWVKRVEAIERGQRLYVFEDRGRRFAVLICEDLAEEEGTLALVRSMSCSVLVTIVMDGPVSERRWHGTRSGEFAARTGALTVVANSLLLPNLKKKREDQAKRGEPDPYPDGQKPVGLVFVPTTEDVPLVVDAKARATPVAGDWKSLVSDPLLRLPLLNG